jgi:hypothetical protein
MEEMPNWNGLLLKKMQIKLAERFYGFSSDEKMMAWIEVNSEKFRQVITTHPEYVEMYEKGDEEVLKKIEEELYIHTEH